MTDIMLGVIAGWITAIVTLRLYIRGKLRERWYVQTKMTDEGYELWLRKGNAKRLTYRVAFDRKSSANPDHRFVEQLTQARQDAWEKAETMNTHERLCRDKSRRQGTPGGLI